MAYNFAEKALAILRNMTIVEEKRAYVYPNFNAALMQKIQKQMRLDEGEKVLYVYDLNFFPNGSDEESIKDIAKSVILGGTFGIGGLFMNDNQYAFIITDRGIYYRPNSETIEPFYIGWSGIASITSAGLNIIIDNQEGRHFNIEEVNSETTGIHSRLHVLTICDYLNKILNEYRSSEKLADSFEQEFSQPRSIDESFAFCEHWESRLPELPQYTQTVVLRGLIKEYINLRSQITNAKIQNSVCTKIDNLCNLHLNIFNEENPQWHYERVNKDIVGFLGINQCLKGNSYLGLKTLRRAMDFEGKFEWVDEAMIRQEFEENVRIEATQFLARPIQERRFLVIDSSMSYLDSKNFIVLPKDHLPEGILFPFGHPQERELYVCHPYNHNLYIPYESSEFELFKDKMDELRLVLQAMGAVSIKISDANDSESHKNDKNHIAAQGSVNAKINKVKGEFDRKSESDEYVKLQREYETESIFEPQKMPYIPDNLVWYPHQADWQRLFEQRKEGLMGHRISISVAQETKVSKQQQLGLKADFQALILKVNAGVNIDTESMFEKKESSSWVLDVKFASLEVLRKRENAAIEADATQIQTTAPASIEPVLSRDLVDKDQKYMDEAKFCLEDDGKIDVKERRLLERFRVKYGISEERAAKLEAMVTETAEEVLSTDEQEYCDAATEYMVDGELSEADLRLLARLASSLDITPEREKELLTKITQKNE